MRCLSASSCRAQRLMMWISFEGRPLYGLIRKKFTNYSIKRTSTSLWSACGFCMYFTLLTYCFTRSQHTDPLIYSVSCRMEIQTCRRKRYSHLGFIDPITCNWRLLRDNPNKIFQNLYKYLAVQHDKYKILFSDNFG